MIVKHKLMIIIIQVCITLFLILFLLYFFDIDDKSEIRISNAINHFYQLNTICLTNERNLTDSILKILNHDFSLEKVINSTKHKNYIIRTRSNENCDYFHLFYILTTNDTNQKILEFGIYKD